MEQVLNLFAKNKNEVCAKNSELTMDMLFSALRGPPLDENLLLSNIATANKKVEHLTEVIRVLF